VPLINDMTLTREPCLGGPDALLPLISPTTVFTAGADDNWDTVILPFTFNFNGGDYTTISINVNGLLSFDGTFGVSYNNPKFNGPDVVVVAPWWDDLRATTGTSQYVKSEAFGTTPNQFFVIEWEVGEYGQDAANYADLKFQVVLYETSSRIEFRYAPIVVVGSPGHAWGAGATIGVADNGYGRRGFYNQSYYLGGTIDPAATDLMARDNYSTPIIINWPGEANNTDLGEAYGFSFFATSSVQQIYVSGTTWGVDYTAPGDGHILNILGTSWSDSRDSLSGTYGTDSATAEEFPAAALHFDVPVEGWLVSRAFMTFDTSQITSVPDNATLKIAGYATPPQGLSDLIVVKSSWTGSALTLSDFDAITGFSAGNTMAGNVTDYSIATTTWLTASLHGGSTNYNEISLNAAARADITLLDNFSIVLVNYDHDYLNVEPVLEEQSTGIVYSDYSDDGESSIKYHPHISILASIDPPSYSCDGDDGDIVYTNKVYKTPGVDIKKVFGVASANVFKIMGR